MGRWCRVRRPRRQGQSRSRGLEHFGNSRVLRAEAESAGEVEADAGVGFAGTRDDHRRYGAGAARVAGLDWTGELMRLGDERAVIGKRESGIVNRKS